MHVLVIPWGLYGVASAPQSGIFESHQVAALHSGGMKVGVLSGGVITTRYLGRRFPYAPQEICEGVPVHRAYRRSWLPARFESPIVAADRTYKRVKPLFSDYIARYGRPDIIHAHNLRSGGLIAARIHVDEGIPYVVTEHTSTYAASLAAVVRDKTILDPAFVHAGAVLAVGEALAENLRDAFGGGASKIDVVPNVVDRRLLDQPFDADAGPYTVVGLGHLIPRKNYRLLLEAFSRAELPHDARLVLGGRGPEARRLRKLAISLGIAPRVSFPGLLGRDQVVELLRQADLFAHPSNSESFGVVLIEALAMGVPVLATASYGPLDIVTQDVGRLTSIGDVQAFADGLSELYERRADFPPGELREACRRRFGPEAFASRMLEIYREAIAPTPAPRSPHGHQGA